MREADYQIFIAKLTTDEVATRVARPGLCRVWTREAIRIAKSFRENNRLAFRIEAREKDIEIAFSHTFLRLLSEDSAYIFDGTGTGSFEPYFGLEAGAPHLSPSHIDMIQAYELADEL